MATAEDEFNEAIQEALQRAARVDASVEDYIAGLRQMRDEVDVAIRAAEADLAREERSDQD